MSDGKGGEKSSGPNKFSLRSGKVEVGPSSKGFDQGSAYDAMNSEETGIDGQSDLKNYGDRDA
jgi:hypothetical protein